MKYLISTNVGDFIFTKKRNAKTWLNDLHKQNPQIKSVWVYDHTGWWESCAKLNEQGKAVDDFYCPDGELRIWVIWACHIFDNNDYCKEGYETAYYLVCQLERVRKEEEPKQGGYICYYEEFAKAAKKNYCYTFEK